MVNRGWAPVRYPHRLRIADRAAGSQDPDTGAHTPGAETVLYHGGADVQDEGETMRRDSEGRPLATSEAVAYLESESPIATLRPGLACTVTWEDGTVSDAEIINAVRLDGKLHLRWL